MALLIEKGAKPTARALDGTTPLHLAAANGRESCATLLLEKGADVLAKTVGGQTPRQAAEAAGLTDLAALLAQREAAAPKPPAASGPAFKPTTKP
jgi:ankyrin repeat protein